MDDVRLQDGTTVKDRLVFELTLTPQVDPDGEVKYRNLTFDDPITTGSGLSAIQTFKGWLLGNDTMAAYPAIVPNQFFQPTSWNLSDPDAEFYETTAVTAKHVVTTEVITTL